MHSAQPAKTVAISYGLNEGPRLAKRLSAALKAAGYTITKDQMQADVIIAHSGGCLILHPRPNQPVIMIGIPYRPDRSLLASLWDKIWGDIHTHHREGELRFWTYKTFWNLVYSTNIRAHLAMWRGRIRGDYWRYEHVTVVRNEKDAMCTPNLAELPFTTKPVFVELPGHHDDLWRRPAAIVRIVQRTAPINPKR